MLQQLIMSKLFFFFKDGWKKYHSFYLFSQILCKILLDQSLISELSSSFITSICRNIYKHLKWLYLFISF